MAVDARYLQTTTDSIELADSRQFGNEKIILYSSNINNELITVTKANFIDDKYLPKCRLTDVSESENRFIIDEVSDLRIYSVIDEGEITDSVESYSNAGRSKIISSLLDHDVSAVKLLNESKDESSVIDIDEKYIPFLKLMTIVSTGLDDFNLIKTIHENSMHPHESLDKDVVTKLDRDPIFTNDNGMVSDLRTNTVLGFESESIQFK